MRIAKVVLRSSVLAIMVASAWPATAQTAAPQNQPDTPGDPSAAPEASTEDIVVTGLRRSLETAQARKRDADQFIDSVVAEDIGKLPDLTASASLARVTGVQVNRAAGEAAQVQVRGLPDLSTTYNGREIFTAEGRAVAIQDFPAGGVAALEVYKASTANLIEGGIAGQINVRSRRPFDFDGLEIFGSAGLTTFENSGKDALNLNLLVSNRWETGIGEIGVLVNAAYVETKFLDVTREQQTFVGITNAGQGTAAGQRFPDRLATFYGEGDRWRPSVNAAIQWKPTPELEIYADGLFQGYRGRDSDRILFVPVFGPLTFSNVVAENGQLNSATVTGAAAPDGFQTARDSNTDTYQIAGGVRYESDRLKITSDVAYTDSTFTEDAANLDYTLAFSPTRNLRFRDPEEGGPSFDFGGAESGLADPNNFIFRGLFDRQFRAKGSDIQGRFDVDWETGINFVTNIQVGGRFNDRDAERRNGQRYTFVLPRNILYPALPVTTSPIRAGFRDVDSQGVKTFVSTDRDSIRANIDDLRTLVGSPTGAPPFNDADTFTANEKAYAGYAQVKYGFGDRLPIDGVLGLRVVKTRTTVSGTQFTTNDPDGPGPIPPVTTVTPVSLTNEYTDYLPSITTRVRFTDQLQLRGAYTENRTRPNFDQLNPTTFIAAPQAACFDPTRNPLTNQQCFRTGSTGNPNLQPLQSENYDISLEYYFSRAGSASVALFRRDVTGFIDRFDIPQPDPVFRELRLSQFANGGDARLQGVEVAFASFFDFDFVPEWARAFGIQANYTYIDSESELAQGLAAGLPAGVENDQRITGVSKHSYNIVALYERPTHAARLAYNYRSDFVNFYGRIFDPGLPGLGPTLPQVEDGRGILDLSASVTPIPNITVAFDATNLLGEPIRTFRQYNLAAPGFPVGVKYVERTYALSVRVRY